uniref:DNA binding protein n=1 Tax=Solanum tuberosum TaxID=4113 RepID=M1AHQ6_SOLTU
MAYDNSSTLEPKRSHQWFMDGIEPELLPNKKQAIEVPNHSSFSGLLSSNIAPWMNTPGFHSVPGQYAERQFDNDSARSLSFDDNSVPSVGIGNMNMSRKVMEDPFGSDSSFGLSISHTLEDHRLGLNYSGIRKVKVSQVKEAENFMPVSMGDIYTRGISNVMPTDHAFSKAEDNCIAMGLSFNGGDEHLMSLGDTFNREDNSFISMGQPFNKVDSNEISVGHSFKESSLLSMSHPFCKDESNITMLNQSFSREDDSAISVSHSFNDNNTAISMGQQFSNDDSNITSVGQTINKMADTNPPMSHCYSKVDDNAISVSQTYSKVENNNLSMSQSFGNGESNIISFGGFNDDDDINSSGRLICSYDLLMSQSSGQQSDIVTGKRLVESNADTVTSAAQMAGNKEFISKKEEQKATKKPPSNSFPSNVRSLLSTGMLDGVPVKYIAWSREVNFTLYEFYLCNCDVH